MKKRRNMFENEKPIQKDKLNDQVYDRLCSLLREGEFTPGKPVSVSSISDAFQVSAMPVREALTRLTSNGVLTNVSGRSVGVPALNLSELDDLRNVRLEIEPLATRWAVENRDEVFLRDIAALLEKLELSTNAKDHRQFVKLNYKFHLRIYTQSRSSTLVDMIETLWLRVSPHLYFAERDKQFKVSNEHHRRVVDMIRNGDPDRAAEAIRDDLSDAYEMLLRNISSELHTHKRNKKQQLT